MAVLHIASQSYRITVSIHCIAMYAYDGGSHFYPPKKGCRRPSSASLARQCGYPFVHIGIVSINEQEAAGMRMFAHIYEHICGSSIFPHTHVLAYKSLEESSHLPVKACDAPHNPGLDSDGARIACLCCADMPEIVICSCLC